MLTSRDAAELVPRQPSRKLTVRLVWLKCVYSTKYRLMYSPLYPRATVLHDVPEDRPAADLDHRLGADLRLLG